MQRPLTVEVDLIQETEVPEGYSEAELADLVRYVLAAEGQSGDWSVAVVLTSDESLRSLHRDYMGIDSETDVMTFPSEGEPGSEGHGGDIVISIDRAADQAPEYGLSTWEEIRFLVAHGVLHLSGWKDSTQEERTWMLARQQSLIQRFDQGAEIR